MESSGGFSFNDTNQTMRKKRSDRRPRNNIQQENNNSSLSSSPPSNTGSKGPSDDNGGHDSNHHKKILNLNQCNSRASYTNFEPETQATSDEKDTGADTSEVFASNYKDTKYDDGNNSGSLDADSDPKGVDNVVKKVKLKVGGVIRTLHANPSVLKPPRHSKQKQNSQENPDPQDLSSGLRGIPWKDFSRSGFSVRHTTTEESISKKHNSVKNSKRIGKKRVSDDNDDEDEDEDDDAELRYLMKLKSTKVDDEEEGGSKKHRKISSVLKMESFGSSMVEKEKKKLKTGTDSEDTDYTGEEVERVSAGEDSGREMMTVTTRRKALESGDSAAIVVEYPHGLPPAPPRKQKEKLSEVEHQLKKAEAAQRRKIQAAKAAQESEAEAIRKILGQDSSRKKREMKLKQRQEELAQERNLNAATLSSNTVRLMIGPTGTVVTFSADIGLPNIFESKPCSYPPPREKCAGPACSKPFKYRDSRSKLPLCSLQCYKAVQQPGSVY